MIRYQKSTERQILHNMLGAAKLNDGTPYRFDAAELDARLDAAAKTFKVICDQDAGARMDAGEDIFLARQLLWIQSKTANTLFEPLDAFKYVPVDTSMPSGAEQFSTLTYTQVGMADFVTNYGTDFLSGDVFVTETLSRAFSVGNSYRYSIMDIRRAAFGGVPLESMRASNARMEHETKLDQVATSGDTVRGITGLMNNANVTLVTAGGGTIVGGWETASAAVIKADLAAMESVIVLACAGHSELYPNTLLLDDESYMIVNTRPATSFSDVSILRSYGENSPYIRNIAPWVKLRRAGAAGVRRSIMYRRDPDCLDVKIPQAFEQFAPQQNMLEFVVPCHSRITGVTFYKPMSAIYADGLTTSTPA